MNKAGIGQIFKEEDTRFCIRTGFKFVFISIIASLLISYVTWVLLEMNSLAFSTSPFVQFDSFKEAYFDFILQFLFDSSIFILAFYIVIFICGVYSGSMLIRPFRHLSDFCDQVRENNDLRFNRNKMMDFKMFRDYASCLFDGTTASIKSGEIKLDVMTQEQAQIRDIPHDKTFLVHFFLFTGIILLISTTFFVTLIGEAQESTIALALKLIPSDEDMILKFFHGQQYIFKSLIAYTIIIIFSLYTLLSWNLYSTISGATYGFILTIKSFLKGNHSARVHLIGKKHIRRHSRKFNKYLDYFCRELKIKVK